MTPQPRLPHGQVITKKWPVLTYGETPSLDLDTWTFRSFGLVEEAVSWTWKEFLDLPQVQITSDVHCVTRWSRFDNKWEGVAVAEILRRVRVKPEAVAVMVHAEPDYTTNLLLSDLRSENATSPSSTTARTCRPSRGSCRWWCRALLLESAKWATGSSFWNVNAPGFWEITVSSPGRSLEGSSATRHRRPTPAADAGGVGPRAGSLSSLGSAESLLRCHPEQSGDRPSANWDPIST